MTHTDGLLDLSVIDEIIKSPPFLVESDPRSLPEFLPVINSTQTFLSVLMSFVSPMVFHPHLV